jgi:hypothetical protein
MTPLVLLTLATLGCESSDERIVRISQEHAARQAELQRQTIDLQKQVAEGSRHLVESDAKARQELSALQRDLQDDQAKIHRGHDQLEAERRAIAAQRYRDPILAAIVEDIGIVLACLLPLALGAYVLWSARHSGESDAAVTELLVQQLVAGDPQILQSDHSSFPTLDGHVADLPYDDRHQGQERSPG